ncbi:MAG: DNA polymerase III subunit alpha [Gemmataceae bacterium]
MVVRPFVHLHCHTHYSLLDGASRVPELIQHVKKLGMNACALTDHGNLYGAIEFYREARAAGINPIIGYEAYVAPGKRTEREAKKRGEAGYHLTLLAKNERGFKNLIKLASYAFLEGYYYIPRIDKELLEAYHEGLICLSGCASSEFSEYILKDQIKEATEIARYFHRLFKENFYIEIQNNGLEIQRLCAAGAIEIANKLGLPLVATCDAHYLTQKDAAAHDVLLCINTGKTRDDANRMRYGSDLFYVRAPEEMYRLFPEQTEAVKRTQEIADSVDIQLDFKKRHFPVFVPPDGKTPEDYLRELCHQGACERYGVATYEQLPENVRTRLEHELGIINRMGFASYFLIVADFVRFAVEQKIPCTARGSACGALVSYVLKLSHVDPLEFDLLFERFLDPSRSEAPDIDIDFCQDRREEVIAYVKRKYGEGSVAQIATFGTMAARAALRDVGRVLGIPLFRVDEIAKMVPQILGISLDEALELNSDLKALYDADPQVRELIDISRALEGTNRNTGTHAAGVVIANGPIIDYVPVQRVIRKGEGETRGMGEPVLTTQWTMGDIEKVGLLKMDFLGLRTLTLLENCKRLIKQSRGIDIDLFKLPENDPETYALLQRGDAKGVFQLESEGIRELLKRLRPDNIRDIGALMALYRPGPLEGGMVDDYVNIKHGRAQPTYAHPILKPILEETYSVLVYQEQIMRILNLLGGIELGSAYACIKAISKKKQDIIDARKADFVKGATERGLTAEKATEIFELIEKFARYGFNKSHTAAYAQVGYQTAYLKTHYRPEFMAALLTSEIDDGNKRDIMVDHIADARRLGVDVLPPDINCSESDFSVSNGRIVFGLAAIKGCGRNATDAIVRARQEGGPFRDLFDFCERVDSRLVTKAAIERLIKAGAFDNLPGHRAQQLALLPRAVQAASERQSDKRRGQSSLFDANAVETGPSLTDHSLPDVPPWPEQEKLKYEKEVLDFYFSSHPLAERDKEIARYTSHRINELKGVPGDTEVTLGGMLSQIRIMSYKKPQRNGNTRYGRCRVDDLTGSLEAVMWGDEFTRYKDHFKEDEILLIRGKLEKKTEEPSLQITRLLTLDEARQELATTLHLLFKIPQNSPPDIDRLASILKRTPGSVEVMLTIKDPLGRVCVLKLGRDYWINPATYLKEELEDMLGPNSVFLR